MDRCCCCLPSEACGRNGVTLIFRLHAVELSQSSGKPGSNGFDPSPLQQWGPDYRFGGSQSCAPTGWLVLLLIKAGDVKTNPGPTNTRKQVWIYDICHRQIQVRKSISISCNRIKHWVHLRCSGIRLAQYTDAWTCHKHK